MGIDERGLDNVQQAEVFQVIFSEKDGIRGERG